MSGIVIKCNALVTIADTSSPCVREHGHAGDHRPLGLGEQLTANQRAALKKARVGELRRTHTDTPGSDPWPANANTLHSLVRRNLLVVGARRNRRTQQMTTWTITARGRFALEQDVKERADVVHGMRAKGSATSRLMIGGVWREVAFTEPEKVGPWDTSLPEPWHREGTSSQHRHAEARDAAERARELARNLRAS